MYFIVWGSNGPNYGSCPSVRPCVRPVRTPDSKAKRRKKTPTDVNVFFTICNFWAQATKDQADGRTIFRHWVNIILVNSVRVGLLFVTADWTTTWVVCRQTATTLSTLFCTRRSVCCSCWPVDCKWRHRRLIAWLSNPCSLVLSSPFTLFTWRRYDSFVHICVHVMCIGVVGGDDRGPAPKF